MHAPLTTCRDNVRRARDTAGSLAVARSRAVITGVGLLTPLGLSASDTWGALLAGGYIRDHAPVPLADPNPGVARVNDLAIRAARQAVACAGWSAADLGADETAVVVGTSKGPIESWVVTPPPAMGGGMNDSFGLAETCAAVARDLRLGRGARLTVSAACATGLHALIRATMLIESAAARRVLVVAAESSLGPLFVGSFKRLGVIAQDGCRPFDVRRTGFLMSEGAAAVCLEAPGRVGELDGSESSLTPLAVGLENYSLGADATHLTGGDRAGQTLRHLLTSVLAGRPVDFVHAHGTGTEINDATELAAIDHALSVIGQGACPVYSHKASLGHSLGAAGLTAVVLSCLVHRQGIIPPNVRTTSPEPSEHAVIRNEAVRQPVSRSLAVAAGFGGAAAVVSLTS